MVKKKVALVTGAAGFIGANLVRKLLKEGFKIHVLLKETSKTWRLEEILDQIEINHQKLTDQKALEELIDEIKPSFFFHLAAHGSYPTQQDVEEMIQTNIGGTYKLLAASQDHNYEAFINVGTSSEYGFKGGPMKETDLLEPSSFYAATKAGSTLLCQTWAKVFKKPVVTVRPFSVYGPWEEKTRFIPTIVTAVLTSKEINLTSGEQVRDFVYVEDFTEALIKASELARKLPGEVVNTGTGVQTSLKNVVEILFKAAGKKVKVNLGGYEKRAWDTNNWVADTKKASRLMSWEAKYDLNQGLSKSLRWFRENKNYYL